MSEYATTDGLTADSGGIDVRITNGDDFAWGETIEGIVTLFPSESEVVTYGTISVSVVEQDVDGFVTPVAFGGLRDPLNPIGGLSLGGEVGPVDVEPVEIPYRESIIAEEVVSDLEQSFPFTLTVPMGIALSATCYVAARATATAGVDSDRHTAAPFLLVPPRFLQAIRDALHTFGDFEEIESIGLPKSDGEGYTYTMNFVAPSSLQNALDGVKFELEENGGDVTGIVEINPQEHTFADHLRSFIHADLIRIPVVFERAELEAAGSARIPSEAARQRLHELLDPIIKSVA